MGRLELRIRLQRELEAALRFGAVIAAAAMMPRLKCEGATWYPSCDQLLELRRRDVDAPEPHRDRSQVRRARARSPGSARPRG